MKRSETSSRRKIVRLDAVLAGLLCLMLCCSMTFIVMAENAADEPETAAAQEETPDTTYAGYLRCAADATTQMVARAIQENVFLTEGENGWDFRTVQFASPKLALIAFPSEEQRAQISQVFMNSSVEAVRPMASAINSQFSEDYAKLADSLYQSGDYTYSDAEGISAAVVLLFYDRHISLTMIVNPQDAPQEERQYGAVFLMSDHTVLPTVDETYLPQKLSEVGLTGEISQVLYDAEAYEAIMEEAGYDSGAEKALAAAAATDETYVQMGKELVSGPAYSHNSYISADELVNEYVREHEEEYPDPCELIIKVRDLTGQAMAGVEGWMWNGISAVSSEPYTGPLPEKEDGMYQADKKILVVTHDEDHEEGTISYSMESVLPTENLPGTPEEADQIIYVDSSWIYSGMNNGIKIYDSVSSIALYDAKTMEKIGDIGSASKTLSGFVMVSGDSYYAPVNWSSIQEQILAWVGGGQSDAETEEEGA